VLPYSYQIFLRNCSFGGCAGEGSANVNLNQGNNLQVSEIHFENCVFKGYIESSLWKTESAIIGGFANTKNFSFTYCSFLGYNQAAINLEVTDILRIDNCTFAHNKLDISCLVCNTLANNNYSEHSGSFFRTTVSDNISFTTLMNNCFYGSENNDYIITQGSGNLTLINNNFGGMGGTDLKNKVQWDSGKFSSVYSIGNYFRNDVLLAEPFQVDFINPGFIKSFGDKVGTNESDIRTIDLNKN
jgi:hypothetical protein